MKRSVFRSAFLITILMVAPAMLLGRQSDPKNRALAEKLLKVMKSDRNVAQIVQAVAIGFNNMIAAQNLTEEQKNVVTDRTKTTMEDTMKQLLDKSQELIVDAYATAFTPEELEGIIAFYESPSGQKLVDKQPQLMDSAMQRLGKVADTLLPDIQRKIEEESRRAVESSPKK